MSQTYVIRLNISADAEMRWARVVHENANEVVLEPFSKKRPKLMRKMMRKRMKRIWLMDSLRRPIQTTLLCSRWAPRMTTADIENSTENETWRLPWMRKSRPRLSRNDMDGTVPLRLI